MIIAVRRGFLKAVSVPESDSQGFESDEGQPHIQSPRLDSHVMRMADMIDWCERSFCAFPPESNSRAALPHRPSAPGRGPWLSAEELLALRPGCRPAEQSRIESAKATDRQSKAQQE